MDQLFLSVIPLWAAVLGVFLGIVVTWLLLQFRFDQALLRTKSELELQQAKIEERLASKEQNQEGLRSTLEAAMGECSQLRAELKNASERRAIAEERNTRIPELEAELDSKESLLSELRSENTELRAKLSEVETRLI
ncbi:MAG TPA: DNA recombination protein RmuC, partial [Syntrophobacteraceae bacterium]|nr:DNA recombination protein RmuC [Syntrophobacteraceae bacterium]